MIPQQQLEQFDVFGDNATKVAPDAAKYAAGFQESDVLPAEWMNYMWNKNSKGITDLNKGVTSMEAELGNVVTAGGATPAEATNNQVITAIQYMIAQAKAQAILAAHPVGSFFWTSSTEAPAVTFGGGTWEQIKDKFVLAAGDIYTQGATGGNATITITVENMPSHNHSMAHTHSVTAAGSISVTTNPTFTGSAVTSGKESAHENFSATATTTSTVTDAKGSTTAKTLTGTFGLVGNYDTTTLFTGIASRNSRSSDYGNFSNYNASGTVKIDATHQHRFTASGTCTGDHTHSVTAAGTISGGAYKFTGSAVTSGASSASNTGSKGNGTAIDIMPPYIAQFCWKRTA